jgi:hypothetical protein
MIIPYYDYNKPIISSLAYARLFAFKPSLISYLTLARLEQDGNRCPRSDLVR